MSNLEDRALELKFYVVGYLKKLRVSKKELEVSVKMGVQEFGSGRKKSLKNIKDEERALVNFLEACEICKNTPVMRIENITDVEVVGEDKDKNL